MKPLQSSGGEDEGFKGFGKKRVDEAKAKVAEAKAEEDAKLESTILTSKMMLNVRARRETELDEKISKLREEEALLATDPSVGAVPELIANRMIGRIATFFGVPVFGGLAIFVGAFFYSKKYDMVVPPAMIAYATQVPFVLGLMGITYGIISSSWDEEPGSALGLTEAKINIQRIKDGLTRTRQTAELKEEIEKESKRLGREED